VDCVRDKNQDLCQQEAVKAYPTFHYYHYGKFAEKYDSDRTVSWGRYLPRVLPADVMGNNHCRGMRQRGCQDPQ
jgi:hypothetical protein